MRHENYMAALIRRKTLFCRFSHPVGVPVGIADPPPGGRRLPECGDTNLELVDGLSTDWTHHRLPVDFYLKIGYNARYKGVFAFILP